MNASKKTATMYVLKDIKSGRIICRNENRELIDKTFEEILEKAPWASDFLRVIQEK